MTDRELFEDVRRLRGTGASPKAIARALGVRPAVVASLVRRLAAETPELPPEQGDLVGCWVSPGWSHELLVQRRNGWDDVGLGPDGPAGIALVLIARAARRDAVTVCGFLVDTFCLGVKNTIGPETMRARELRVFARTYFAAFPAPPLEAPLDLARHLVHGAVAFAAGLGFEPHADFAQVRDYLGALEEPCAITFGREGHPVYVSGPHDDATAVMRTLQANSPGAGFSIAL